MAAVQYFFSPTLHVCPVSTSNSTTSTQHPVKRESRAYGGSKRKYVRFGRKVAKAERSSENMHAAWRGSDCENNVVLRSKERSTDSVDFATNKLYIDLRYESS